MKKIHTEEAAKFIWRNFAVNIATLLKFSYKKSFVPNRV